MPEQDGLNSWAVVKRVIHLGWGNTSRINVSRWGNGGGLSQS
jgi:hypothetical protein